MIKVGLVGPYGHVPSMLDQIAREPDVSVAAISEMGQMSEAMRRQVQTRTSDHPRVYESFVGMAANESLDAVIVCVENARKPNVVEACLQQDWHVLAEKPLALDEPGLRRVELAHRQSKGILSLMLSQRYRPDYQFMRDQIQNRAIGELVSVFAANPHQSGGIDTFPRGVVGSLVANIAIHIIDLVVWMTGQRPVEITGYQAIRGRGEGNGEIEDSVQLMMKLENGAVALLDSTMHEPRTLTPRPAATTGLYPLIVTGTEAVLESLKLETFKGQVNLFRHAHPPQSHVFEITTYREVMRSFLRAIRTSAEDPILPASAIFTTSRIVLEATEAAETGRKVTIDWRSVTGQSA